MRATCWAVCADDRPRLRRLLVLDTHLDMMHFGRR
jgi:hypothetical protein